MEGLEANVKKLQSHKEILKSEYRIERRLRRQYHAEMKALAPKPVEADQQDGAQKSRGQSFQDTKMCLNNVLAQACNLSAILAKLLWPLLQHKQQGPLASLNDVNELSQSCRQVLGVPSQPKFYIFWNGSCLGI